MKDLPKPVGVAIDTSSLPP